MACEYGPIAFGAPLLEIICMRSFDFADNPIIAGAATSRNSRRVDIDRLLRNLLYGKTARHDESRICSAPPFGIIVRSHAGRFHPQEPAVAGGRSVSRRPRRCGPRDCRAARGVLLRVDGRGSVENDRRRPDLEGGLGWI